MVTESLWHTPHACTRTRTWFAPGAGTSRVTTSSGPPFFTTCTYLPVFVSAITNHSFGLIR